MTDEALARQLQTTSAIHDAIFAKQPIVSATAEVNNWEACPMCGSGDIEGSNIEIDGQEAWQPVSCLACGAHWTEVYRAWSRINIEGETT